ncbi:RsmB/NOP family class I SAM-dependent RNA methyltransferase [Roseovarius faecimaris]|uniref:RsmB/NOP family class I SAM-dependent RNA methyltransferase n=1 Tax=Roseovarius faecimaris TaxID=2494550 RepID=A0A6I6J1G0_9RHOB|nr:RsmB/NOP family class I SAM-dependent RNA methyltransferase [Roseovarius faecimaris]QGX98598.1 RsmB/NOP family class I SAM-dependent RNA methyltransferase [Roseovarius faecimaris]
MTPAARVQAAIEVLDDILAGTAAEKALTGWGRRSRFAGSKDRRAVRDHVFQALRSRRSFAMLGGGLTGRGLMIGMLRDMGQAPEEVFTGEGYAPTGLSGEEQSLSLDDPDAPWNLPDWLIDAFRDSLGEAALAQAKALTGRAPVMLRVNLRKNSTEHALSRLAEEGVTAVADPISDAALRVLEGAPRIAASAAYRDGLVELQDGSSQAAMTRLEVPPGAKVLDYCAGGGGKTLALAARHEAEWFAHDAEPGRMADLASRAERAGISVTQLPKDALASAGPFDVILCDAPCSGSGTWRRTPDAKWVLTPDRLEDLVQVQGSILDDAAAHVAPDGCLAYATCSVLACENTQQITRFLQRHPDWTCRAQEHWAITASGDGFFLAQLVRV